MADNKLLRVRVDRIRVNSTGPYDVEDLHQKFPHLTHGTIANAVRELGPDNKKVEKYLRSLPRER